MQKATLEVTIPDRAEETPPLPPILIFKIERLPIASNNVDPITRIELFSDIIKLAPK